MSQLDKKDRQLLYEFDCNSRISFVDLGKKLRMTPEAVRYRYQKLRSQGVLESCFAIVDSGMLGFMQYKIFLKFQSVTEAEIKEIIHFSRSSSITLRGVQLDGAYDLIILCRVIHLEELDRFIVSLVGRFSSFIRRRSVALNVWARYLPRAHFAGKERSRHFDRGYGTTSDRFELDRTNKFILKLLAADSRMGATEIADAIDNSENLVSISSFAVGKRIDGLIRAKVITGFAINLNYDTLDLSMFKVLLYLNPMTEAEAGRFVTYCQRHPQIVHLMKTIAEWDYEIDIEAEDVRAMHGIVMALTREFPRAVHDYTTLSNVVPFKYRFLESD